MIKMTSIGKVQIYFKEVFLKRIGALISGEYYKVFLCFKVIPLIGLRK
jgi:hypothetical protein